MKKLVSLVLALMLIGVIAYAQGPGPQGPGGDRKGGPMMNNRIVYGIPNSEFEALGLTKEQHDKIVALQSAYDEKYMKQGQAKSAEEKKKLEEESRKANKQLLKDVKAVFTADQLKAYEKLYKAQVEKTKQLLTKQCATISEKISLTKEQNEKVSKLIKNFDGDQFAFYESFTKLLTDEQKTAYDNYVKEQWAQMMKSRNGGPQGQDGPGGYKPDAKPDYQPDGAPVDENGILMPPPEGQPGMGDGNGVPPDFKPDFKPDGQGENGEMMPPPPDGGQGGNGEMMPPPPDGGNGPDGQKPDFKPDFKPDQAP